MTMATVIGRVMLLRILECLPTWMHTAFERVLIGLERAQTRPSSFFRQVTRLLTLVLSLHSGAEGIVRPERIERAGR